MSLEPKLSSVKIIEDLKEQFNILNVNGSFTIQKLVNRAMYLFNTDEEFRKMIKNNTDLASTGSF